MTHILIIDDSPTEVQVFTRMLEKGGFRVTHATNAEDGIAQVKSQHPDLVIMDVIMPGMNGFQATRTLSRDSETSDIPILIVTTKAMESDRMWGLRQGARDFMTKPVDSRALLARIQGLLPN